MRANSKTKKNNLKNSDFKLDTTKITLFSGEFKEKGMIRNLKEIHC